MKYVDLLVIIFILISFATISNKQVKIYFDLCELNKEYQNRIDGNNFISTSFRNTCEGKGFDSLIQWQKVCKDLWKLKYIGWSNAEDFLMLEDNCNEKIFYGTWIGNNFQGEVYWGEDLANE